jgi:hypothetical protein
VKRYDFSCHGLQEHEEGDLVNWKDVKILVGKLKGLETKIARIEDGCNCEDQYNELKALEYAGTRQRLKYWICPAHGYKKLYMKYAVTASLAPCKTCCAP